MSAVDPGDDKVTGWQGDKQAVARRSRRPLTLSSSHLVTLTLFLAFLALYGYTAAPSVLSGDSAEFQFAAPLLGMPHPTTYPLYVLLGKLATLAIPFGDMAWRVTLVSAGCAALAVALFFLLARRIASSTPAAALAALALGLAAGPWNAATLAEVYALLLALLVGLGYLLATTTADRRPTTAENRRSRIEDRGSKIEGRRSSILDPRSSILTSSPWRLRCAAFLAGLGLTHHGLFALVGLPLFASYVLWLLLDRSTTAQIDELKTQHSKLKTFRQLAILALCFTAGLAPWLYPLIQYARYGPFDGDNYGLPRHYFWGSPVSWGAVIDLMTGGTVRRTIFRVPSIESSLAVLRLAGDRLVFEFGPIGVLLGAVGCAVMARRARRVWFGAVWVVLATLAYLLLLGPAVEDAPVFTLPILLPWALWIAVGIEVIIPTTDRQRTTKEVWGLGIRDWGLGIRKSLPIPNPRSPIPRFWSAVVITLLVAATLAWGYTRLPYSNKRHLWQFRRFGEATLARLPADAVVMTHWEQGTTLQYLVLAERRRPDVWVDIVEPGDDAWGPRARRRYTNRPVFLVGSAADVAGLSVELVREDAYADLFRLRE